MVLLPLIILVAFEFGGGGGDDDPNGGGAFGSLVDLATSGGLNFALFCLAVSAGFLLVVVVALFCGDTVASEASWGSLRYLLAVPVPRARLLGVKLVVALGYSLVALLLLTATGLLVGTLRYGWHPLGSTIAADDPARPGPAAAARHRGLPGDHPAGGGRPGLPAVGAHRRGAGRGGRRRAALDPVQHPRPDHRAGQRPHRRCRPTTATPGSACCPPRRRWTTWSRAPSRRSATPRCSGRWRSGGSPARTSLRSAAHTSGCDGRLSRTGT